jgi:hypothetical protein
MPTEEQNCGNYVWPGTDVMILKIFLPKNLSQILAFFLLKLQLVFLLKLDHNTLVYEKNAIFSP